MWFYCYCAGVALNFKHLSNTSELFVCSFCSPDVHQALVCQLQSEITILKDDVNALSNTKQALCDKVYLLKATIAAPQHKPSSRRSKLWELVHWKHQTEPRILHGWLLRRRAIAVYIAKQAAAWIRHEDTSCKRQGSLQHQNQRAISSCPWKKEGLGNSESLQFYSEEVILQFAKLPVEATPHVERNSGEG